jgi:alpha-glucosidase
MEAGKQPSHEWWKEAIVYQIYPASFLDSNGDGLGDIPGIVSKLDYIQSLGVSALWLSPIFKSPQHDMGYDISDYRTIHAPYGSVEDVEEMIQGCHQRDIKVLLDLVVNHTSHEHEWFQESRSSKASPKRDWYIWRDAKYDSDGTRKPPNNWASIFGGSAWTWDEVSSQYYLSLFLPEQPDLNWTSKEMREATYADMEFWLDRGVDGFRIDSMNLMSKHPELPDAPVVDPESEFQSGSLYYASGPKMHDYIREMRLKVFDKYDCMTVGELGFTKDENSVAQYVARDRHELNMVFTGDIVDLDFGSQHKYGPGDFQLSKLRDITNMWQRAMPKCDGWNAVYMDNHDSGRSLSRYASDHPQHRKAAAKMLATYLSTLSGTLFLLQGQEIGMANIPESWGIEEYIDVEAQNYYKAMIKQRGEGSDMSDVLKEMRHKARDNGRLPMQWDSSKHGGFTNHEKPWMRVNDDYIDWNAKSQENDDQSILSHWKRILQLRKDEKDVFVYGRYEMIDVDVSGKDVFAYTMTKWDGAKRAIVLLNFSAESQTFYCEGKYEGWRQLLAGHGGMKMGASGVKLGPYEGVIYCNW